MNRSYAENKLNFPHSEAFEKAYKAGRRNLLSSNIKKFVITISLHGFTILCGLEKNSDEIRFFMTPAFVTLQHEEIHVLRISRGSVRSDEPLLDSRLLPDGLSLYHSPEEYFTIFAGKSNESMIYENSGFMQNHLGGNYQRLTHLELGEVFYSNTKNGQEKTLFKEAQALLLYASREANKTDFTSYDLNFDVGTISDLDFSGCNFSNAFINPDFFKQSCINLNLIGAILPSGGPLKSKKDVILELNDYVKINSDKFILINFEKGPKNKVNAARKLLKVLIDSDYTIEFDSKDIACLSEGDLGRIASSSLEYYCISKEKGVDYNFFMRSLKKKVLVNSREEIENEIYFNI